jgi:hypothetical protein
MNAALHETAPVVTRKRIPWTWAGITAGLILIAVWFAVTRTTLVLAYRGGTLSQVQGICDSSLGRFGRAMSAQGAAGCNHIDGLATWWNAAGVAGLLLIVASAAVLIYQSQRTREPVLKP